MKHLIPSFVLLAVLIVSWKWEKVGGITLLIVALAFGIFIFVLNFKRSHSVANGLSTALFICTPFVLAGTLFIVSHFRKKEDDGDDRMIIK